MQSKFSKALKSREKKASGWRPWDLKNYTYIPDQEGTREAGDLRIPISTQKQASRKISSSSPKIRKSNCLENQKTS
jgi:hypothetical protein